MAKFFLILGSFNAGLCVILGAFAAHKLKTMVDTNALVTFQTGVQYHFYHSLALILLGLIMLQLGSLTGSLRYAGFAFIVGMVLFSGSLYGLSLGGPKILGPITPLGGLWLIVAWVLMAIGIFKSV